MQITKYLHSCLLIKEQNKTILIDPGNYTYDAGVFDINKLTQLDYLVITHEHADHMHLPFIKDILIKLPGTQIFSNSSVVALLEKENITASVSGDILVTLQTVPHEDVVISIPPNNTLVTINQKLTHPGDSLSFSTTAPILALPIQAPWGSMTWSVKKALELRPEVIIPIHDWHWKDEARKPLYKRLDTFFAKHGIQFKGIETGETIEV